MLKTLILLLALTAATDNYSDPVQDHSRTVESLRRIDGLTPLESDSIFLSVTTRGLDVVPDLIEQVESRKKSRVGYVLGIQGKFTVGDVALAAIARIIDLPLSDIAGVLESRDRYGSLWNELHGSRQNRTEFVQQLRWWYEANRDRLVYCEQTGKYTAPPPEKFAQSEEDILVQHILYNTDRLTIPIYIEQERESKFWDYYLRLNDWDVYRNGKEEEIRELEMLLLQMRDYAARNPETDTWNADAPVLGQRRFSRARIIPGEESHRYRYGTDDIPAGDIYRLTKPLYDYSGRYALVEILYRPSRGSHGRSNRVVIFNKRPEGWIVYRTGPWIME